MNFAAQLWRTFLAAFGYFSILPVPGSTLAAAPRGETLLVLPFVGMVLGASAGAVGVLAARFTAEPLPAVAVFATLLIAGGALHFDGLLDVCDAFFAQVTPAERHRILKDPTVGSFAVAGAAIVVPLWICAVADVPTSRLISTISFTATAARFSALINGLFGTYDGETLKAAWPAPRVLAGGLTLWGIGLGAWAMVMPPGTIGLLAAGIVASVILGRSAKRRFDGVVGDVYGALIVCLEVFFLVGFAVAHGPRS